MSGVPDVVIRALAGHKSEQVQRKYSHVPQVIDFDEARKKLERKGTEEPKKAEEPKTTKKPRAAKIPKAVLLPKAEIVPMAVNQ
jgi:hypothetical protein